MDYNTMNRKSWECEIKRNIMLYPSERVVAFVARNYKDLEENKELKVLDIGVGSGRNLKVFLDYNFNCYGLDYSQESCQVTRKILSSYENFRDVFHCELRSHDVSAYYDAIVCYGGIFLKLKEDILIDLKHIFKMLKVGGRFLVNFRTKDNTYYGRGKQVEESSYVLDESTGSYNNMLYTYLGLEECKSLVLEAGFEIENVEREDFWKYNLKERNSWWIFTLIKKDE